MSREPVLIARPLAVWLLVTVAVALAAWSARSSGQTGTNVPESFADLLVVCCALTLVLALAWLWVITSVTVAQVLTGRVRSGGGTTRRLVLLACGVAVLAGTGGAPAVADEDGTGASSLVGLALPDRAVADGTTRATSELGPARARGHVVRPGDSLWSIALTHPGAGSTTERWRAIWAANRDVIGADPDLILPGQVLRLP